MDSKIKFVFGFNSGRYEVMKGTWNGIDLEIYHHKGHEYNLARMMGGLKASLAYCSNNFGTYQHKQARIIEFPVTEGSYATTFANSFPFSELRFIADIDDTEDGNIDLPFYITAHEMAHQWWGNQVIPANVAGAKMLTESLSEYVALKVLEQRYGKNKMRQFLKYDLDIYLRGRSRDVKEEYPLMYNKGQHYIAYSKGALVFYALSDYLGEETLNQILKSYVEKVRFQDAPYTTSIELVDAVRAVTPDSLQYLIEDMFETITLYDNKMIDAAVTPLENGQYQIDLTLQISKYRTDGFGKTLEAPLPLADYIEVGIFGKEEQELYLQKHKFTQINNTLTIILDQKPVWAGVDPYQVLIDRETEDNWRTIL
jgi:ABC-2 type transport system permease protein